MLYSSYAHLLRFSTRAFCTVFAPRRFVPGRFSSLRYPTFHYIVRLPSIPPCSSVCRPHRTLPFCAPLYRALSLPPHALHLVYWASSSETVYACTPDPHQSISSTNDSQEYSFQTDATTSRSTCVIAITPSINKALGAFLDFM